MKYINSIHYNRIPDELTEKLNFIFDSSSFDFHYAEFHYCSEIARDQLFTVLFETPKHPFEEANVELFKRIGIRHLCISRFRNDKINKFVLFAQNLYWQ